jgi:hypothetical protein
MEDYKLTTTFVIDYLTLCAVQKVSRELNVSKSEFIRRAIAKMLTDGNYCRPDVQSENA